MVALRPFVPDLKGKSVAETASFKYRAFLSYSHADTGWAKWLHARLESFRLDKDPVGRETRLGPVPKTLRPIFRDREDFSGGHTLTEATVAALDESIALIVLCSPVAAGRPAINEEVRLFRSRHPDRPVIPVIIDGMVPDNFPPAMRFELAADGAVTNRPITILGPDLRDSGDGKNLGLAKTVAGLTGLDPDDVYRRAERQRRQRLRSWVVALSVLAAIFAGLALWAEINRRDANVQRQAAEQRRQEAERNFNVAKQSADGLVFEIAQGLRDVEGMRTESIRKILGRAEQAYDRLVQGVNNDPKLLRSQAAMFMEFAETYAAQGDTPRQLASAQASRDIMDRLTRADPGNAGWRRDLSVAYGKVGDVLKAQGDLAGALKSYRDGLDIRDRLTKSDPGNASWQRDLSLSYEEVGDVLKVQGDLAGALKSYRDSLDIRDRLTKSDPGNASWQRDLSLSYEKVGDVLKAQGDLADALKSYRDSLDIRDRLTKSDPGNAGWQRDLSLLYDKVGNVQGAQGDLAGALKSFGDSVGIRDRLAKSDPGNARWQSDLSWAMNFVGDVQVAQGRPRRRAEIVRRQPRN
jgi:tetratricopeptide (TPR) repeat protein